MLGFISKILLLAITIAFIGSWGIVKQQRKTQELLDKLYKNAESKIIKAFRNQEVLSIKQIEDIVKGTKASLFWSKNKIQVTDPKLVAKDVVKKMIQKGIVREEVKKSKKIYVSTHFMK